MSFFARRSSATLISLALLCWSALAVAAPRPFEAQYLLDLDGWPDVAITHTLSHEGSTWESEMRASIKVASGEESSRFSVDGDSIESLDYRSSYSLFGIGDDYHLGKDELAELPDRQTAIFMLSSRAPTARCANPQVSPCELVYQDHKGRDKELYYRVTDKSEIDTPAGRFPGVTVDAWDPEKRDRHFYFTFHENAPGLLLKMRYVREGEERSQLALTALDLKKAPSTN